MKKVFSLMLFAIHLLSAQTPKNPNVLIIARHSGNPDATVDEINCYNRCQDDCASGCRSIIDNCDCTVANPPGGTPQQDCESFCGSD
jgi:hypothetical protein